MAALKRLLLYLCIFSLAVGFAGCANTAIDTESKIVSPQNKTVPILGEWKFEKCLLHGQRSPSIKDSEQWENKTAVFSANEAVIGDYYWDNIGYKIRKVNAHEYFLFNFKDDFRKLGITDKEVYVITLSSSDNFLYEFAKVNDNELIVNIDGDFFRLTKISDRVDSELYGKAKMNLVGKEDIETEEEENIRSGILLGIRTPVKTGSTEDDEAPQYSYRTIWIASSDRKLHTIMEADGIFLPRKSGFWYIDIERIKNGEIEEDILTARRVPSKDTANVSRDLIVLEDGRKASDYWKVSDYWKDRTGVLYKTILFIGNDYVSIETLGHGNYKGNSYTWQENRLKTIPVDNIQRNDGVKISDIAGENGLLALESAVSSLFEKSDTVVANAAEKIGIEENFALFRRTGHWFVKGRINIKQADSIPYVDYNINLIPPPELVAFDTLHLPWKYIKDKVPGAVDAYTSPNKDIALILTQSHILIYKIEGDNISEYPLEKIKLNNGDAVIMAEWARGDYVEKWEKSFIKNNEVRVVEPE
ncbi:MAG TPA: hypothetical protein GXX36_03875 [Clostridiaceae bacterium]|nr:hypothetical protein [Clostridiaceae bacterium]